MQVKLISFNGATEPDWGNIPLGERIAQGKYGLESWFMQVADYRDPDYEFWVEWEKAFSEGYLLHYLGSDSPETEDEYENEIAVGLPVLHGPYFIDQQPNGNFIFHGPKAKLHGPISSDGLWGEDESLVPSWIFPAWTFPAP